LRYKNRKKQAAAKVSQGCQRRCQPVAWNLDEPVRVLQAGCCYSMEWLLGGILSLGCILSLGLRLQFRWLLGLGCSGESCPERRHSLRAKSSAAGRACAGESIGWWVWWGLASWTSMLGCGGF
jgi:hypothetical protein